MTDYIDWTARTPELQTNLARFLTDPAERNHSGIFRLYAESHLSRFANRSSTRQQAALCMIVEIIRITTDEASRNSAIFTVLSWLTRQNP